MAEGHTREGGIFGLTPPPLPRNIYLLVSLRLRTTFQLKDGDDRLIQFLLGVYVAVALSIAVAGSLLLPLSFKNARDILVWSLLWPVVALLAMLDAI